MKPALLSIDHLRVDIGRVKPVRDVSLTLDRGECLAVVGESGCGKSMTAMSLLGLLPRGARLRADHWQFDGQDMQRLDDEGWRKLRGRRIAAIFQNPVSALNPTMCIGDQIAEPLRLHRGFNRRTARAEAVKLMEKMAIPRAAQRARQYPFEFSGGMLQRVMIAMAVACDPELLIADEPTTALDVTVQAEVLALLDELRREQGMALLLITHDLGVVARMADRVAVMYAGEIVEQAPVDAIFHSTAHPYTEALKLAMPDMERMGELPAIPGSPPDLSLPLSGCAFLPRCNYAMQICQSDVPLFDVSAKQQSRCWRCHQDFPGDPL